MPDDTTQPRPVPEHEGGSSARAHTIRAIPTLYRGICFRSRLEARWAATFDQLGWYWSYEPYGVDLGDGMLYLPDFRLPRQRCWVEVKGPYDDRLDKTRRLRETLTATGASSVARDLVVIARIPGPGDLADWEGVDGEYVGIYRCDNCGETMFLDQAGMNGQVMPWRGWGCRVCKAPNTVDPLSEIVAARTYEIGRAFGCEEYIGLPFATIPAVQV